MKKEEAVYYVSQNLGIDITASNYLPDPTKIQYIIDDFPYKGIILVTGRNHLLKAGRLCYELLKNFKISGSIERFESWEYGFVIDHSISLLLCTNLSEDLIKPQTVINIVSNCMKLNIPMIFTTPLTVEGLEGALPLSVLSNIVPYIFGKL